MPDPQDSKTPTLSDAAHDVFAFAIEFPAGEIPLVPAQIGALLKSDAVKEKLQSTLLDYAMEKTKKGVIFDQSDPKLGLAILNGLGPVAEKQILEEIKKGLPARRVTTAFNDFVRALKNTPMGVWVDKEKNLLIVVGVVLAVGGTAALFYTRTDSDIINFPISQIKGKAIPLWSPGSLKLSGSLIEFQPAQRKLGLEIIGEQKWQKLDLTLKLGVVASEPAATQGDGHALVTSKEFTSLQTKYSLGVELKLTDTALPGPFSLGLHAAITNDKFSSGDMTAKLKLPSFDVGLKAQTDAKSYTGLLTISGSF
jgi:hypothetical protein